jgi:hypothetical protein
LELTLKMLAYGLIAPEEMLLKIGKFLSLLKVHAPLFEEEDQQRRVPSPLLP